MGFPYGGVLRFAKLISFLLWLLWNQAFYAKLNVGTLSKGWAGTSEKRGPFCWLRKLDFVSHVVQVNTPAARPLGSFHGHRFSAYTLWSRKRENKKIIGCPLDLRTVTWWLLRSDLTCRFRILTVASSFTFIHVSIFLGHCKGKHQGRTKTFCLQAKTF